MALKKQKSGKEEHVYGKAGVFYRFPEGDTGPIQITVDFALTPPPQFYYYADAIDLRVDQQLFMAVLSFGRREAETGGFADRIDIVMPAPSLFHQFWMTSAEVQATVNQVLTRLGATAKVAPTSAGSSQAMTLFANMIFMAVGEGESSLDFYHLSPRDVHMAKTRKLDMQIQPVVRVILSSVMTKYFFDLLRPHSHAAQPSQAPERRRERATASR